MSQHPNYGNTGSFNSNINSFNNVWNNYTIADDRPQLLAWLSPLEPGLRHRDIQERRVGNVGEWLVKTEEFGKWHGCHGGDGDKAVLFCYGGPGVGKTFISSLVVDRLCDEASGQNAAVAYFYFDFATQKEQSATSMLGSLLKQVVGGVESIPQEILQDFQEQKIGGRGPQLPNIVKMLQAITSPLRTFICIDALDECAAMHRVKLLGSLKQILDKSPRIRIIITGRPHILAEVEKRLSGRVMGISLGPSKDDIIEYLRARLDEDETPDAMDDSLEADILEKIPEKMSEMFLLVSLNIDAILHESTISRRREKLRKMTNGLELGDVYGATIERIKAQAGDKSRLGMAALMWISHAERPLQADELCRALAVELGSMDFDFDNIPSMSTVVSCCQGLITVDKGASAIDKGASTVRLIHFTLQEYFSSRPDIFSRPHSAMAEVCLTYLNSRQIKTIPTAPFPGTRLTRSSPWRARERFRESYSENAPFLEYCSAYWGVHAKRDLSDYGRLLALNLLKEDCCQISTRLLMAQVKHFDYWDFSTTFGFSGLHCASFFGIAKIVAGLIEMECHNINKRDFSGSVPLVWAAQNGHEEVVKILLGRREVNPDQPDNFGQTPLWHAAQHGHEGVVKILLGREVVNPDRPGKHGRTPLSNAALCGHEGMVKLLLERGVVNPDKSDRCGHTPLSLAAQAGHEGVVKLLLEREGVNPDGPDLNDRTPLSYAAQGGHEGMVKLLLERGEVDPDKPDEGNRTPLSYAAECGHEGVVKLLLKPEEVNPDKPDEGNRTPLSYAAEGGHEGVVKLLLDRGEVNPDKPDCFNQTPISLAAQNGHQGVVALLRSREAVPPYTG